MIKGILVFVFIWLLVALTIQSMRQAGGKLFLPLAKIAGFSFVVTSIAAILVSALVIFF